MRKSVFTIALLLGLQISLTTEAQNGKVTLRVPNFVRPLVEKWVAEYQKTNTNIDFQFISGKSQDNENTITLSSDDNAVFFARYAVLPVTTKGSEADLLVSSHSLNAKKLKSLFFVRDEYDEETKESKAEKAVHIYSGNSQLSASRAYATHFKQEIADYKGKKISGDDSFLNVAISRDPLGVTVNSLSNIFNLENRRLRQELALLPLDLDKQGKQAFSESHLDDIIALLEQHQYNEIPVEKIGFEYNHANSTQNDFVHWVLTNGTRFIHHFGLLNLPQKELAAQLRRTEQNDLAQN